MNIETLYERFGKHRHVIHRLRADVILTSLLAKREGSWRIE